MKKLEEMKQKRLELTKELRSLELTKEDFDKKVSEINDIDTEISEIEKRNSIISKLSNGTSSNPIQTRAIEKQVDAKSEFVFGVDSPEYRSAFYKKLAEIPLNEVEQRALTTNSSSAGASIPTSTMNKILEKIENGSVVYNLVQVAHLKGQVVIPIEDTTADVERKGEGANGTDATDTLGSLKLGAKKYIKIVKLTCELEAQAIDALEDYIVSKLSKKLMLSFDDDIINGNGVNGAKGILTTITAQDVEKKGSLTFDDICNLFASIPATARKNAVLMMSTNTLFKQVKQIKDTTGKPIFDPDQNIVIGRDVIECDYVPDGTLIFGDFSEYIFNWNKEAEISKSTEVGFTSGDSYFRILALVDGGLADLGAMAVMKVGEAE